MNGDACCSPGFASFGGIFRDYFGNCLCCFANSLGLSSFLEAELHIVIDVVDLAWEKGWNYFWIECDFSLDVLFLSSSYCWIPWHLHVLWFNCLALLSRMHVHVTHIFQEGNLVANFLANFGVNHPWTFY